MFKRLFNFLARAPEHEVATEDQDDPQEQPVDMAALEAFARLVTRHLRPDESERLTRRALRHSHDFLEALTGDDDDGGQVRDQWLLIQGDWKAADEVQWQVDLLLSARGIEERWVWEIPEEVHKRGTLSVLKSLARWLQARGFALLHIDSGGDDYHALILGQSEAAEALKLGAAAGVPILSHADFLIAQQDEDADWFQQDYTPQREALISFVRLATRPIGAQLAEANLQRILAAFDRTVAEGDDFAGDYFIAEAFDEGIRNEPCFMIWLSWKWQDRLQDQANMVLATHGFTERWTWHGDSDTSVEEGLRDFDRWLAPRGYTLVHFNTIEDFEQALVVELEHADALVAAGQAATLQAARRP